jgi:hypothetical protein
MIKSSFGSILLRPFSRYYSYKLLFLSLLLAVFMTSSCKKDNPDPSSTGEITLSSKTYGTQTYYLEGYSFENQEFYPRTTSGTEIDIYLNELLNTKGELNGVQFTTSTIAESTPGYYLNAGFESLTEAEEYYNNYVEAFPYGPEYVTLTDTLKAFQVYTFKTWKLNYVKFFIKDIRVFKKGELADYYMEVDIKYFIQRDGTINLAN